VRALTPILQINAVAFTTSRAPPVEATTTNGDRAVAGAVLNIADRFDVDTTGGSGLEGVCLLGHGKGGGTGAKEREACEGSQDGSRGEHIAGWLGKVSVLSGGLRKVRRENVLREVIGNLVDGVVSEGVC
jgi:hypothetical protein